MRIPIRCAVAALATQFLIALAADVLLVRQPFESRTRRNDRWLVSYGIARTSRKIPMQLLHIMELSGDEDTQPVTRSDLHGSDYKEQLYSVSVGWPFFWMYANADYSDDGVVCFDSIHEIFWPTTPDTSKFSVAIRGGFLVKNKDGSSTLLPVSIDYGNFIVNFVVLAGSYFTIILVVRFAVRNRRLKRGCCPSCGYSLVGSGESGGRCPECGCIV